MKKILVITVLLLTLALLSIPVMAAPATKIEEVTMMVIDSIPAVYDGYPRLVSHDTISHGRGDVTGACICILNIPGVYTLEGSYYSEWMSTGKFKRDPAEIVITGKVVLTFTEPGATGTFKGIHQRFLIGYPVPSYFEDHLVLQGTGDFEGQTLNLSYKGAPPPVAEGTLIIP